MLQISGEQVTGETSIINIMHMGLFQKEALDDRRQEITPQGL